MKRSVRIMGIDPGAKTGIAIIDDRGNLLESDTWGAMRPFEVLGRYNLYGVHIAILESAYIGANARSALSVARQVGRWQEALESRGIQVILVPASEWQCALLPITPRAKRDERKAASMALAGQLFGGALDEHASDAALLAHYGATEIGRCEHG
jgi:Holliday junction resolvasome RuvABC endonuclease subunit